MSCQRPPTPRTKMGERGFWTGVGIVVTCYALFVSGFLYLITRPGPPSIYEGETPLPLIRYLNSDNHITIENLTRHFSEYRESILEELDRLNDDMYVDRIFKGGVWYYRLNGWGILYLDYLEARQ